MSPSRSPSPRRDAGRPSPGLDISTGDSPTPVSAFPSFGAGTDKCDAAKMKGFGGGNRNSSGSSSGGSSSGGSSSGGSSSGGGSSNGGGSHRGFSAQKTESFTRHMRRLSRSLPTFHNSGSPVHGYVEKDKHAHSSRWTVRRLLLAGRMQAVVERLGRKARIGLLVLLFLVLAVLMYYVGALRYYWRRVSWIGGGERFVIVLASNVGGGVMEWKGAREWAIEHDSVRNKQAYAERWGYDLEILDMSSKKRYAHEWRESWEKVDWIRRTLDRYPKAEWVWWLDLNTFIMEPSYSLQRHIFDGLAGHVYRDINEYNPLGILHPFTDAHLDDDALSAVGDGRADSINLVLSQDCSGFNLGSFFVRRGAWSDRLLDMWWDPITYEQKHMVWEHKEQDALAHLYTTQPWVRRHTAFLPQRMVNSFPAGACSADGNDSRIHYDQRDRDFLVNMAGCEWGRDCWGEMYSFRELSRRLNRGPWARLAGGLAALRSGGGEGTGF